MNTGRPSLYKVEYCQLLIDHMKDGNSFWSFAGVVSVCFDTLSEWTKVHAEFSEAKRHGMAKLLLYDEKIARAGSTGQLKRHAKTVKTTKHDEATGESVTTEEQFFDAATFGQSYQIFLMKNRYPKFYRDKIVVEAEAGEAGKMKKVFDEVMNDPKLAEAAALIAERLAEE